MSHSKERAKDHAAKGAAVAAVETKREAEATLSGKRADDAAQPSQDSPKRQGDKLSGAVDAAAKR
jgi:hypothetical protein